MSVFAAEHKDRRRRPPIVLLSTCAVLLATATGFLGTAPAAAARTEGPADLRITTVSNPNPAMVSGDEVLVRITGAGNDPAALTVNGHTAGDLRRQSDGSLLGLVTGLRQGANHLVARSHGRVGTLTVVGNAVHGPIFSGPQPMPFYCETTSFGLAAASQPYCAAATMVSYQYRTTGGAFAALADPAGRPADLATTTVNGRTVPYIVRVETGTLDRAVYQTAALYDGSAPTPLRQDTSWNGRLVYAFGGGCEGGHDQGTATGGVLNDLFLARGYAVASSTLNVLGQNCSIPISAEAAMMVKEHFIDTYGPVAHTIGWGGSGGGIQQYDIADAYPGILDGVIPAVGFPDPETAVTVASDCRLLDTFFASGAGSSFTAAQKQAVGGFLNYDSCVSWDTYFGDLLTPAGACVSGIPVAARWNATTNPNGVKCGLFESDANQFGRDPMTGFVRSTLDNIGVQYGLAALRNGQITPAQFVALNTGIGGFDPAGTPVAQRTVGDPRALDAAYRDDLFNSTALGLRSTPIIEQREDMDASGPLWDVHTTEWSYVMRARLQAANGTSANQVIIESGMTPEDVNDAGAYELTAMDQWLNDIEADHTGRSRQAKVITDKPAGLGDGCFLSSTDRVVTHLTDPATGPCAAMYPVGSDTRLVAGAPAGQQVLKCALRPLDFADYQVTFTAAERALLRQAFPTGVCDYSRPGVGQHQQPTAWRNYSVR